MNIGAIIGLEWMTKAEQLSLDAQLCFAIYSTAHAFNRAYKPLLDALGLTYPQYLVLLILWEGGSQTVGGISERLMLDSSTLTPLLKRLEAAGFLARTRDGSDERVVNVTLTEAGRQLRQQAEATPVAMACAIGESDTDRELLREAVLRVRASLNRSASCAVPPNEVPRRRRKA